VGVTQGYPIPTVLVRDFHQVNFGSVCPSQKWLNDHNQTRRRFGGLPRVPTRDPRALIARYTLILLETLHTPTICAPTPRELPLTIRRSGYHRRGTFLHAPLQFTYIGADANGVSQVIAMRPVQGISLSWSSDHGYRAFEVLSKTSTPVRRLIILIRDGSAPNELFPQLAARLPHLEALHIIALVQYYSLVCIIPI
jgi:hypothetical protein